MTPCTTNRIWHAVSCRRAGAFRRAVRDIGTWQSRHLQRLIRLQAGTAFGRDHRFDAIRTVADYRREVPICEYADLDPYLERIREGEAGVLTIERVLRFEPTSGTGSGPKHIPYTRGLRREVSRAVAPWIADLFDTYPALLGGTMYWALSPQLRAENDGRIPVGFDRDTGYFGGMAARLASAVMAVPPEVRMIHDLDAFRYATLLFLLARADLRLISVWNPSFLELLLAPAKVHGADLVRDLAAGTLSPPGEIPGPAADALRARIRPQAHRARAVAAALQSELPWPAIWPRLAVISCWADGWAAEPLPRIRGLLPHAAIQPKGLLATEAVITIPLHARTDPNPVPVLAAASHFYEFLDIDSGDIRLAQDLIDGRCYAVVVTSAGGLYRYRMHDRVIPEGRFGQAPILRFVGRADEVSDLRGEKLHESFVAEVLGELFPADGSRPAPCHLESACVDGQARYELVLDASATQDVDLRGRLDALLRRNPHYAYCRDLGQLEAPAVRVAAPDPDRSAPLSTAKHRTLRVVAQPPAS